MVYLLAPHSSVLQMTTMKFWQDFIGPLFIDTTLDKMHYRLKDATVCYLTVLITILLMTMKKHLKIRY